MSERRKTYSGLVLEEEKGAKKSAGCQVENKKRGESRRVLDSCLNQAQIPESASHSRQKKINKALQYSLEDHIKIRDILRELTEPQQEQNQLSLFSSLPFTQPPLPVRRTHPPQNPLPISRERSSLPRHLHLSLRLSLSVLHAPGMERDEPSPVGDRVLEILSDGLLDVMRGVEFVEGSEVFVDLGGAKGAGSR